MWTCLLPVTIAVAGLQMTGVQAISGSRERKPHIYVEAWLSPSTAPPDGPGAGGYTVPSGRTRCQGSAAHCRTYRAIFLAGPTFNLLPDDDTLTAR